MSSVPVAFVGGASGYSGRGVVSALLASDVKVVAHVRPDSPSLSRWRAHWEPMGVTVDTTAWEPDAMTATLQVHRPALVFGCLGTTRSGIRAAGERDVTAARLRVDYGMTAMLIQAAESLSEAPRFVYVSAMGVRPVGPGSYYHARWRVEEDLRASSLPWTIARPAFISGQDRDERRPLERLGARVFDGLLSAGRWVGGRALVDRFSAMGSEELGRALVAAALAPAEHQEILPAAALRARLQQGSP